VGVNGKSERKNPGMTGLGNEMIAGGGKSQSSDVPWRIRLSVNEMLITEPTRRIRYRWLFGGLVFACLCRNSCWVCIERWYDLVQRVFMPETIKTR